MTYHFKCIKAFDDLNEGDIIEMDLKVSEYDRFKEAHPELERYFDEAPAFHFVDMVGKRGPDGRVLDRLDSIRRNYPGAKNMFENARWTPRRQW